MRLNVKPSRSAKIISLLMFWAFGALSIAQADDLLYGTFQRETHPSSIAVHEFLETVRDASSKRLTIKNYYDGDILSLRTGLQSVRSGLVDFGLVAGIVHPRELPAESMIMEHSVITSNPYAMSGAVAQTMYSDCVQCGEEHDRHRILPMAYLPSAPFFLACRRPIESMSDFESLSIRAQAEFSRFVEFIGATPVSTSMSEIYDAMQRGQVDCFVASIAWIRSYRLDEVTSVIIDFPLGQAANDSLVISQKRWSKLDPELRRAVIDGLPRLVRRNAELSMIDYEEARAEVTQRGVDWITPPDGFEDAYAEFRKISGSLTAANAERNGLRDAESAIAIFDENVAEWNALTQDLSGDPQAYETLFKERIVDPYLNATADGS